MNEQIVLVDEHGAPIGTAPKLASHNANTPLHLAFSCYIFDRKGNFLLTRRTLSKKVWPGVLTISVCGHPAPGEKIVDAIKRRARDELGLSNLVEIQELLKDYRYTTPPFNGIIENEICPVFMAVTDQIPRPNPEEVDDFEWKKLSEILRDIAAQPDNYSYWFKDELKHLKKLSEFRAAAGL